MKTTIVILICAFTSLVAHSAELTLPKTFENGEVADAEDFNANFNYLKSQIAEQQIQLSDVSDNAPWLNRSSGGDKEIEVDCSLDADALRVAYHANLSERHLVFVITGSCLGSIHYLPYEDESGELVWGEIQPKNQVLAISGNEGAKIIPRVAHGESRAGLVVSFGNGIYINGVDIEMGDDDNYAILFSRNSNGGFSDGTITGLGSGASSAGIRLQYGASAYLQGEVTGVDYGVYGVNPGSIRMLGLSVTADIIAITSDGGQIMSQWGGTYKAPTALYLANGAQAKIEDGADLIGNLSVNSRATANITLGSLTGTVVIDTANLELSGNIPADIVTKVSCSGLSQLQIDGVNINNNDSNQCLDKAAWNSLINAAFP